MGLQNLQPVISEQKDKLILHRESWERPWWESQHVSKCCNSRIIFLIMHQSGSIACRDSASWWTQKEQLWRLTELRTLLPIFGAATPDYPLENLWKRVMSKWLLQTADLGWMDHSLFNCLYKIILSSFLIRNPWTIVLKTKLFAWVENLLKLTMSYTIPLYVQERSKRLSSCSCNPSNPLTNSGRREWAFTFSHFHLAICQGFNDLSWKRTQELRLFDVARYHVDHVS